MTALYNGPYLNYKQRNKIRILLATLKSPDTMQIAIAVLDVALVLVESGDSVNDACRKLELARALVDEELAARRAA